MSYTKLPEDDGTGIPSLTSDDKVQFGWNGRVCTGSRLHLAAKDGDVDAVREILDKKPELLTSRFTYEQIFQGQPQEGSGESLHLAASKGHVSVVELLLARKATLNAMVTRDHKDHYDVFHAAVFAEGRGGRDSMLRYLMSMKAGMTKNQANHYPLHLAFQTGNTRLIHLVREAMEEAGIPESSLTDKPMPLELGIRTGKMSETQLSEVADPTPNSLRIFMEMEPRCIPAFVTRILESGEATAQQLATFLTGEHIKDLWRLLESHPSSACALLDGVTAEPEQENSGWNPLPTRINFGPSTALERLRETVNPSRDMHTFHAPDTVWKWDAKKWWAPPWQKNIKDISAGRQSVDAEIKVCHVPGIVSAEMFDSLGRADSLDTLFLYDNQVIRGSIDYVFWKGAVKSDLMQVLLSVWGLLLLLIETWITVASHHIDDVGNDGGRRLAKHGGHTRAGSETAASLPLMVEDGFGAPGVPSTAANFIAAKGLVDLIHELVQFAGTVAVGRPSAYLTVGNAWDLSRCFVPMLLFFDNSSREVHVFVIFVYWLRLLEVFTSAETVARAVLPIKNLVGGLVPAVMVTLVGFCAFTHAFYTVQNDVGVFWPDTVLQSFATLLTMELPDEPSQDTLQLVLTYIAVLVFSVFFLNVFIGVIGEQYTLHKEIVPKTFQGVRASSCLTFMLRTLILPCGVCTPAVAFGLSCVASVIMLGVQTAGLIQGRAFAFSGLIFVISQSTMYFLSYQNPDRPWVWPRRTEAHEPGYLWIVVPREKVKELPVITTVRDMVREEMGTILEKNPLLLSGVKGTDAVEKATMRPRLSNRAPSK